MRNHRVLYSLDLQMKEDYRINSNIIRLAESCFGFTKKDVDEEERYSITASFLSLFTPSDMRKKVTAFLRTQPEIHYIDVVYRYETEMTPDRFVIWSDGRSQEYTGHVYYEEDK